MCIRDSSHYCVETGTHNAVRLSEGVDIFIFELIKHFLMAAGNADNTLCVVPYRVTESHVGCNVAGVQRNYNVGYRVFVKSRSFELRKVGADKFHIRISEFFRGLFAFFDNLFGNVKPDKFRLYSLFLPEPIVENERKIALSAGTVDDSQFLFVGKKRFYKLDETVGLIVFSDFIIL